MSILACLQLFVCVCVYKCVCKLAKDKKTAVIGSMLDSRLSVTTSHKQILAVSVQKNVHVCYSI